jgi:hypothetical protein
MFGEKPKEYNSPMDKNDHPELDMTAELPKEDIKKYQSLIGALHWVISLCRFDIHCAVMTMGRFRSAPHLATDISNASNLYAVTCTNLLMVLYNSVSISLVTYILRQASITGTPLYTGMSQRNCPTTCLYPKEYLFI